MGTRSLTFVHEDDGPAIVCVYQQYDGYFDCVGDDILTFLKGSEVVNGIGMDDGTTKFNGAGDLAARLITHFKRGDENDAGGVYLYPSDTDDGDVGTEFAYHIYATVGQEPRLTALAVYSDFLVEGPASEIVWPTQNDEGDYIAAVPAFDPTGPLTPDQRRALFATFHEVFGHSGDEARYAFTRMALGKGGDDTVSWSADKYGTITAYEAGTLLSALDSLNV